MTLPSKVFVSIVKNIIRRRFKERTMELKGSKTEKNLMEAFAGESMARNKYTYYASKAKKKATTLLPTNLNRLPTTKKNMQKSGSNCCMKAPFRIP